MDYGENWHVVRDQLCRQFTQTKAGVHLQVHMCVPLFRISGTAGRAAPKISMLLGQLARQFTQTKAGLYQQVCKHVRATIPHLGTAGGIVLKFAMWVEELIAVQCAMHVMQVMDVVPISTFAQSGVHGIILLKYGLLFDPLTMRLTQL